MTVQRFHDHTRQLHALEIAPATVSVVGEATDLFGPHGTFRCRQVWFVGGHWFHLADDGTLVERLRAEGAQI